MHRKSENLEEGSLPSATSNLAVYRAPWKGHLLLACAKCQKKLKRGKDPVEAAKLNKLLKQFAREDGCGFRLRVIQTPCLKLCPKGGVTVVTEQQLARAECSIVRSRLDASALYIQAKAASTRLSKVPNEDGSLHPSSKGAR